MLSCSILYLYIRATLEAVVSLNGATLNEENINNNINKNNNNFIIIISFTIICQKQQEIFQKTQCPFGQTYSWNQVGLQLFVLWEYGPMWLITTHHISLSLGHFGVLKSANFIHKSRNFPFLICLLFSILKEQDLRSSKKPVGNLVLKCRLSYYL